MKLLKNVVSVIQWTFILFGVPIIVLYGIDYFLSVSSDALQSTIMYLVGSVMFLGAMIFGLFFLYSAYHALIGGERLVKRFGNLTLYERFVLVLLGLPLGLILVYVSFGVLRIILLTLID